MGLFNWLRRREEKERAQIHLEHIKQLADEVQDHQVVNVLTRSGYYVITHSTVHVTQVGSTIIIDRLSTEYPILVDKFEITILIDQAYPATLTIPLRDIVDVY